MPPEGAKLDKEGGYYIVDLIGKSVILVHFGCFSMSF